ncbi:MAG: hypothetical protein QOE36_3071, partial [Gaiellaceae bacterium]|nr:hypothetical protein [Gaiellaceae bacterium]
ELVPEYERLYAKRAYLGKEEAQPVRDLVGELRRKHAVRDRRTSPLAPPPEPEQLRIAL